jgi:UDP-glucose/GDP-mannose dehydrogenase family, UDP binding domain
MKDTAQLAAFAQNQFSLGNAAMLVNEGLVLHICDDLRRRYDLSRMTVGLLGMAFKAEIDDTRASLSYKFKKVLANLAGAVLTTDPFVTTDAELLALEEVIARSDILILCAPHLAYRDLDFAGKPVVDIWGFLPQGERDLAARHAGFVGTRLATFSEGREGSHALGDASAAMAVSKSVRALALSGSNRGAGACSKLSSRSMPDIDPTPLAGSVPGATLPRR